MDANLWLGGFAKCLHVTSAYLAELWGAMEGLVFVAGKGFMQVELQMEYLTIVNCLNGDDTSNIVGRQLVRRIRHLFCFNNVRISHVYVKQTRWQTSLRMWGVLFMMV